MLWNNLGSSHAKELRMFFQLSFILCCFFALDCSYLVHAGLELTVAQARLKLVVITAALTYQGIELLECTITLSLFLVVEAVPGLQKQEN